MIDWWHNNLPDRILFGWGPVEIYWYGFFMVLAIAIVFGLIINLSPKASRPHWWNLIFWLIIFGIAGARLYHVFFYNPVYFWQNPLAIFKIWQGGLAIHGAIIAGILVIYFYAKKHYFKFWQFSDLIALALPLGQAIGRWGNYFNQELFGPPCNRPWCIAIEPANRPMAYLDQTHFHPAFLYESVLNLLLFAVLFFIYKNLTPRPMILTYIYLLGYSLIRFITEFWRLDSAHFGALTLVQWFLILVILAVIFWSIKNPFQRKGGQTN